MASCASWMVGLVALVVCVLVDASSPATTRESPPLESPLYKKLQHWIADHNNNMGARRPPTVRRSDTVASVWNSSRGIRWPDLSSFHLPVSNGKDLLEQQQSYRCISRFRNRSAISDADKERITAAVSWACKRMDCSELMSPWEIPKHITRPPTLRYYPMNIVAEADWVFDRWFHAELRRFEQRTLTPISDATWETVRQDACNFGGVGQLVELTDGTTLPTGCTLNPSVCWSRSALRQLLGAICLGVRVPVVPSSVMSEADRRLPQHDDGATHQDDLDVKDAIDGGCRHLFDKLDPVVRDDTAVQAAVALNAHHLIFQGSFPADTTTTSTTNGDGSPRSRKVSTLDSMTCERRFGNIAVRVAIPDDALSHRLARTEALEDFVAESH